MPSKTALNATTNLYSFTGMSETLFNATPLENIPLREVYHYVMEKQYLPYTIKESILDTIPLEMLVKYLEDCNKQF